MAANSIGWKPVNNGEDWERNANFIAHGYTVFDKRGIGINEICTGIIPRFIMAVLPFPFLKESKENYE